MVSDPRISVLTVDDHPLIREGVAAVIGREADMRLAGEASDGGEAIERYEALRPDVTLMDLQMPRIKGLEAIAAIRQLDPRARILVLTTYRGDVQAAEAIRAGGAGYLLKSSLRKDLIAAIRAVHAGQRWIPPEVAAELAEHLDDARPTAREVEVLRRIAQGRSNREIAVALHVSEEAIKARVKSLLAKLEARDRTHAVSIAIRRGVLPDA